MDLVPGNPMLRTVRLLPWIVAAVIWAGLLAVVVSDAWWSRAQAHLPWMMRPVFHDWEVVRLGLSARQQGIDPLAHPAHPYNYPRFVLLGSAFGLHRVPRDVAGLIMAAAVLVALAAWLARGRGTTALAGALAMLSPPVLLLLERGNLDGWTLVLVLGGVLGLTRKRSLGHLAGVAAWLLASLVKLYPAVLLVAGLVAWPGARRRWLLGALAVFLVVFLMRLDEPGLIQRKTGRGLEPAYGWAIAGSRPLLEGWIPSGQHALVMRLSSLACATLLAAAGIAGWFRRSRAHTLAADPVARAGFWAGALVFAGTFALGANWSYRMVFLLPCVPLLVEALQSRGWRIWGATGLTLTLITLWAPFHLEWPWFFLVQGCEWLLTGVLLTGAVAVLAGPAFRAPAP